MMFSFQRQQNELNLLKNKTKLVVNKFVVNDEIQCESDSLVKQWSELEKTISYRILSMKEIGDKWKSVEDVHRNTEIEFTRMKDTLAHVEQVITSKNQLLESLATLNVSIYVFGTFLKCYDFKF